MFSQKKTLKNYWKYYLKISDVKETIAQGMGELHLDVYAQRIGNKHALEIYD